MTTPWPYPFPQLDPDAWEQQFIREVNRTFLVHNRVAGGLAIFDPGPVVVISLDGPSRPPHPFDLDAWRVEHPQPRRREVSHALWQAEGRYPLPYEERLAISGALAAFERSDMLEPACALVAILAKTTPEAVVAYQEDRLVDDADLHPGTDAAMVAAMLTWKAELIFAVCNYYLPGLCKAPEDYVAVAQVVDGATHAEAIEDEWAVWVRKAQELAPHLLHLWGMGHGRGYALGHRPAPAPSEEAGHVL